MTDRHRDTADVPADLFDFDKDGNLIVNKDGMSPAILEKLRRAKAEAKSKKKGAEIAPSLKFRITAAI